MIKESTPISKFPLSSRTPIIVLMPPSTLTNGERDAAQPRSINAIPVTVQRAPFRASKKTTLEHAGEPRANLAPSAERPEGTTESDWDKKHAHQTVLQQHCDFFDRDHDGILWPQDTFIGFCALGLPSQFPLLLLARLTSHRLQPPPQHPRHIHHPLQLQLPDRLLHPPRPLLPHLPLTCT